MGERKWEGKCWGSKCVPPEKDVLKSQPLVPQMVTLFGNRVILDVTSLDEVILE